MNFFKSSIVITLLFFLAIINCTSRTTDFSQSRNKDFSHKLGMKEEKFIVSELKIVECYVFVIVAKFKKEKMIFRFRYDVFYKNRKSITP